MKRRLSCVAALVTALLILYPSAASAAPALDELVANLGGQDELARAEARQLLPREGAKAVPAVLPLLASEDPAVWNAAYNVLSDLANEVSASGREEEQQETARHFMTLIAPEQPDTVKERGLRLLPIVVPEGFDVAPVAAMLEDADWRERARTALQQIGSHESAEELAKAVQASEPDFQCALLNALAFLHAPEGLGEAERLAASSDPRVRAAAIRTLAWTGDTKYVELAMEVLGKADDAGRRETADAVLLLADAAAERNDFGSAAPVYRAVFDLSEDPAVRSAAIISVARHAPPEASGEVVSAIMKAVTGPNGRELEPAALAAFEAMSGKAAQEALIAAYPNASPDMRGGMLGVFGRKHDPVFLDVIASATKSEDEFVRNQAYIALEESRQPGAVNILLAMDGNRWYVLESLKRMALAAKVRGDKAMMGAAYSALFRVSDSGAAAAHALNAMVDSGQPDALALVMKALDEGKLEGAPIPALAKAAKALSAAGRNDDAKRLADFLLVQAKTPEELQEVLGAAAPLGISGLGNRLGFINEWQLVGPFPWSADGFQTTNIGEPDVDLSASYKVKGKELSWRACTIANPLTGVNLIDHLDQASGACGYGFATITLAEDVDAVIRCGSDDGIKIWVNGQSVLERDVDRGMAIDQDLAPVKLKQGENKILVRVNQGGGGWMFVLRVTKPDGSPLAFD
jgi:HEAT repeat protein